MQLIEKRAVRAPCNRAFAYCVQSKRPEGASIAIAAQNAGVIRLKLRRAWRVCHKIKGILWITGFMLVNSHELVRSFNSSMWILVPLSADAMFEAGVGLPQVGTRPALIQVKLAR